MKFNWPAEMTKPLLLSLGLHAAIVLVLITGLHLPSSFEQPATVQIDLTEPATPSEIVQAVTVDQAAVDRQIQAIQQQQRDKEAAEARRVAELERRAEAARKQREAEQKKQRELAAQQERERQQLDKQRADAAAKQAAAEKAAAAAEAKRKREEEAARKAEQARKQQEAEAKRLAAEQQQRELEARQKAERERQLQQQLAEEARQRDRARAQQVQGEVAKYSALIRQTIQRSWNIDESMRGKECELEIKVASSGFVISVDSGRGDGVVCQSARAAVLKVGTLPVSPDPEVFKQMSTIKIKMAPYQN